LLAYYILFHKNNIELAKDIYEKLLKAYRNNHFLFDENEEISLKILGDVVEFFDVMRELNKNKHRKVLKYHLEFLVAKLYKIKCKSDEWSCSFKDLIITEVCPNTRWQLNHIKETCKAKNTMVLDEELIDGYNLFISEEFSPQCKFLLSIAEREVDMYQRKDKMERIAKIIWSSSKSK